MKTLREFLQRRYDIEAGRRKTAGLNRGIGPYLALLDVTRVGPDGIHFRAPSAGAIAILLYWVCAITMLISPALVFEYRLRNRDVLVFAIWAMSVAWAILFRLLQPRLTAIAGKGIRLRSLRRDVVLPPWLCAFRAVERMEESLALVLETGSGEVRLFSPWCCYSQDQLAAIAVRMNAFIWGGPQQPHDPAHPPPAPDPEFAGRKILVDD
jgi:hypothetical protein